MKVLEMKVNNENPKVEVGQFITVVRWTAYVDNSYRGDCLEVVAVDKNLLSVVMRGYPCRDSRTLDLDKLIIRVLSDEFVESVISREPKPVEQQ